MKSIYSYVFSVLSFYSYLLVAVVAPFSAPVAQASSLYVQKQVDYLASVKAAYGQDYNAFVESTFKSSSEKDKAYLVSLFQEQKNTLGHFAFPKVSANGSVLVIEQNESVAKLETLDAQSGAYRLNGLPFQFNAKMGLKYNIFLIRKHLESTSAVSQNFLLDALFPSAHASSGGTALMIAVIAALGFLGVSSSLKKDKDKQAKEERFQNEDHFVSTDTMESMNHRNAQVQEEQDKLNKRMKDEKVEERVEEAVKAA